MSDSNEKKPKAQNIPKYDIPQIRVLIDNPIDNPEDYLCSSVEYGEAFNLLVDPDTGLPVYLMFAGDRGAAILKEILDNELPLEDLEATKTQPIEHQIENALDLLSNTKELVLPKL